MKLTLYIFCKIFNLAYSVDNNGKICSSKKNIHWLFSAPGDTLRKAMRGEADLKAFIGVKSDWNSENAKRIIENYVDTDMLKSLVEYIGIESGEPVVVDIKPNNEKNDFEQKNRLLNAVLDYSMRHGSDENKKSKAYWKQYKDAILSFAENRPAVENKPVLLPQRVINDEHNAEACVRAASMAVCEEAMAVGGSYLKFKSSVKDLIDMPELENLVCDNENDNDAVRLSSLYIGVEADKAGKYLLVGNGGAGKTFMMLDLAKKLIEDKNSAAQPMFFPLHSLTADAENKYILPYFFKMLFAHSAMEDTPENTKILIDWLKDSGAARYPLFLLDGFNEISSEETVRHIAEEILLIQAHYPRVKFIISSRYDISSEFTVRDHKLPFCAKHVKPLPVKTVEAVVRHKCPEFSLGPLAPDGKYPLMPDKKALYETIRSPMPLIMYIEIGDFGFSHFTLGKIIDKYVEKILREFKNHDEKTYKGLSLLSFIAYNMAANGLFELPGIQLNDFIGKSGLNITKDELPVLPVARDLFYLAEKNGTSHFVHQNFRDYFCARYLREILMTPDRAGVTEIFSRRIPREIVTLLAEVIEENKFTESNGGDSLIQQALDKLYRGSGAPEDASAVAQIIEIAAVGRHKQLGAMDFSGLDLRKTSLNGCKLYRLVNGSAEPAVFTDAKICPSTFKAVGSPAAIYALCVVSSRFIVLFAKNSLLCYDFVRKYVFQPAGGSECHELNSPVTCAVCCEFSPREGVIVSASSRGPAPDTDLLWSYSINGDGFSMKFEKKIPVPAGETQKIIVLGDESDELTFLIAKSGGKFYTYSLGDESAELMLEAENEDGSRCSAAYLNGLLFLAYGKKVYLLRETEDGGFSPAGEWEWNDAAIKEIYDIAAAACGEDTWLLINGRAVKDAPHKINAVLCGRRGGNYKWDGYEIAFDEAMLGNKSFKGFNGFAAGFKYEVFVGVNTDSDLLPDFFKLTFLNGEWKAVPFYGRHTMSVEAVGAFQRGSFRYAATGSVDRAFQIICVDDNLCCIEEHLSGYYDGTHFLCPAEWNDENYIFAGQYSGEISAWRKQEKRWKCTNVYPVHTDWLWVLKPYRHNGELFLISCSYDKTLCVTNARTEKVISRIVLDGKVLSTDVFSDGAIIASVGNKLILAAVNYETGLTKEKSFVIADKDDEVRCVICTGNTVTASVKHRDNDDDSAVCTLLRHNNELVACRSPKEYKDVMIKSLDSFNYNGHNLYVYGGVCEKEKQDVIIFAYNGAEVCRFLAKGNSIVGYGIISVHLSPAKDRVYFSAASYKSIGYIGAIKIIDDFVSLDDIEIVRVTRSGGKMLDIKIVGENIFAALLTGEVLEIKNAFDCLNGQPAADGTFREISVDDADGGMDISRIFHTMCGYEMNKADLRAADGALEEITPYIEQFARTPRKGRAL